MKTAKVPTKKKESVLEIYTDGGYSQLNQIGAWAYVILCNGKIIAKNAGKIQYESNNRAELKAIINAVASLPDNTKAKIYSDSQYAIGVLSGVWSAKANTDLIQVWRDLRTTMHPQLVFQWVKGHSGNEYNEMCDKMCDEAAGMDLNAEVGMHAEHKPARLDYSKMTNAELLVELGKIHKELANRLK